MLNLNSTIELDFKKFWRWWRRELSQWIPENIKQVLTDKRGFIIVEPVEGQLILSYLYRNTREPLAVLQKSEASESQYQALLAKDERLAKAQVVIRLGDKEIIHKELVLPGAAKENLQQVIAYELDRYTPFKAEQIYFAAKLLEGDNDPGQIRVMLILTTREILDAVYADVKANGLIPVLVDYAGAENDLEQGDDLYNLLPEWWREVPAKAPQLIFAGLVTLLFVLFVTALAMPVWFESNAVESLQQKIDEVEPEAKKIKAMQLQIDELNDQTKSLIAEKTARPPVVVMLNTLSTLIKDDTSLAYAQYSDGHLQMQGESPAASGLIGVLEASDYFANARFVSPVTQDKVSGLERFQITVDVTKPPELVEEPVDEVPEEAKDVESTDTTDTDPTDADTEAEPDADAEPDAAEPEVAPADTKEAPKQTGESNGTLGK